MRVQFASIAAFVSALAIVGRSVSQEVVPPVQISDSIPIPAPNPHWRPDGCAVCHGAQEDNTKIFPGEQVDLLCLKCHDGVRASREPHPIGRSFSSDQVRRPESWPAPNGSLSCITCHDVVRGCNASARRPEENSIMLRGKGNAGSAFCNECHAIEKHQQFNPHTMLRNTAVDTAKSCVFCHKKEMPAGPQATRSGNPSLINDEITFCGQCHRRHIDFFDPGHIGATATAAILENMQSADPRSGLDLSTTNVVLPLSGGKVVCSTCHNPHQAGVFEESSVLGAGAIDVTAARPDVVALRAPGGQLCIRCHGSINPGAR